MGVWIVVADLCFGVGPGSESSDDLEEVLDDGREEVDDSGDKDELEDPLCMLGLSTENRSAMGFDRREIFAD